MAYFTDEKSPTSRAPHSQLTAITIKNIPTGWGPLEIKTALDKMGYGGTYRFVYVPVRRNHDRSKSRYSNYACVGFGRDIDVSAFEPDWTPNIQVRQSQCETPPRPTVFRGELLTF